MNFLTAPSFSRRLRVAALGTLALAAGCSLFRPAPQYPAAASKKAPAAPVVPERPLGTATHRFEFDPAREDVVGVVQTVVLSKEDTLPDVARRFNVGYEEMVRANPGIDPWLPGEGREVVVPTRFVLPDAPREGIVINVAAMRLYYYPKRVKGAPQVVITHPIGIGKVGWQTPEGVTKIVARVKDPVWIPPESVKKEHLENGDVLPPKVPAGPDNPLGAFMFRLQWPSYLIHGTNKPYGVGMRSSHGCIRLYPEDIAILYEDVPIGTPVRVVNQPVMLGWHADALYVQVYGALEDDKRDWQHGPKSLLKKAGKTPLWQKIRARDADVDWERARLLTAEPRGVPVSVMKNDATSIDTALAAAVKVRNAIPEGATWDGTTGLLVDEQEFNDMLGQRQPPTPAPGDAPTPGSAAPPVSAAAPANATTPAKPPPPASGGSPPGASPH